MVDFIFNKFNFLIYSLHLYLIRSWNNTNLPKYKTFFFGSMGANRIFMEFIEKISFYVLDIILTVSSKHLLKKSKIDPQGVLLVLLWKSVRVIRHLIYNILKYQPSILYSVPPELTFLFVVFHHFCFRISSAMYVCISFFVAFYLLYLEKSFIWPARVSFARCLQQLWSHPTSMLLHVYLMQICI